MKKVMSMQKVKVRGQRSRLQRSKPNLGISRPFEMTYADEMMHIPWCCLGEVPYCFSRSSVKFQGHAAKKSSILTQVGRFGTVTPVWIHQWLRNDAQSLHCHRKGALLFLAATKQLYEWSFPSVCPSVCLSVTPFSPCSHHRIIMKFSGVITMVRSDVHAKGQGQRSKVKVTEVNTQLSGFRTLTPVWIQIWQWNHTHSWKQHRRGALLFFKVIPQISRSHGSKNRRIWPRLGVSGL